MDQIDGIVDDLLKRWADRADASRSKLFRLYANVCPACERGSETEQNCDERGTDCQTADVTFRCKWAGDIALEKLKGVKLENLRLSKAPEDLVRKVREAGERRALTPTTALKGVKRHLQRQDERPGRLLVLTGVSDAGKTFAAVWALAQMGGRFVWSARLARLIQDMDELLQVPLLVINDIGVDYDQAWWRSNFSELLITRFDAGRTTICTTNIAPARLLERLGQVDDRLKRRCAKAFLQCEKTHAAEVAERK